MITIDDKEYRNLQEQVGYLTEELKKIKQSLGSALPEPIEGPQGPQGETGATGPQGRSPKIGFGFGPLPTDDSFQEGDIYIARATANGLTKGNTYKKVNGSWQLQLNIVGPQGPQGPLHESNVIANPEDDASAVLEKLDVEGVVYTVSTVSPYNGSDNPYTFNGLQALTINGTNYFVGGSWAKYLSGSLYFDDDNNKVVCDEDAQFNEDIYLTDGKVIHGGSSLNNEVELNGYYYLSGKTVLDDIQQFVDENNDPIIVCENFLDKNHNHRFVEGEITSIAQSQLNITYAKWSLSGTHLMIVISGECPQNEAFAQGTICSVALPAYILNKITPNVGSLVSYFDFKSYYSNYGSTTHTCSLEKLSGGVRIDLVSSAFTPSISAAKFRIEIDFLIDME